MKYFGKRLAAALMALSMLCAGTTAAAATVSRMGSATIEMDSAFDAIMQYLDWYGIEGDSGEVLRNYFQQYFEEHPEEFVSIVNDIMQSMDPYSRYMTIEEYKASYGQLAQSFYGVGITLDNDLRITDVYEGGVAEQAGLRVGDVIVKVDDTAVTEMDSQTVVQMLRGEENTAVTMVVSRNQATYTYTMTRKQTEPHHVYSRMLDSGVAYVRVAAMGSQEDSDTFRSIWNSFAKQDVRAAILDLRGNGGGLVNMAMEMIETMVPAAEEKYLSLQYNEASGGLQTFYTPGGGVQLNRVIILTDQNTGSAAEIVSGSLSDLGVATLLGTPTYGKGVGQFHIPVGNAVLVLTSMEIRLPVRGAYNGKPLQPDIYLSRTDVVSDDVQLSALDTDSVLVPGESGNAVSAMIERLQLLGYLDTKTDTFDGMVLQALRRFEQNCGLLPTVIATPQVLAQLDILSQEQGSYLSGVDNQLAAALALCKTAAAQPAQYAVQEDGSWTNLT